jgi:SAM-dependent methyltransferase
MSATAQIDSAAAARVGALLARTRFAERIEAARNAGFATYEPWPPVPASCALPPDVPVPASCAPAPDVFGAARDASGAEGDASGGRENGRTGDVGASLWRLAHLGRVERERLPEDLWSDLCALDLAAEPDGLGRFELTAHRGLIAARDRPRAAARGQVHIGEDSLRFAEAILALAPRGHALDVGCGSGISTCALARTCEHVHAIDVVEACLDATCLSMGLNGMGERVAAAHALLDSFQPPRRFDCVVGNLPGVPVPPGLAYPPDGAGGPDGLELMRLFLERCRDSLTSARGVAVLRFQSLGDGGGPLLLDELRALAPSARWDISVLTESRIPAAVRAGLTAHHALPVNPGFEPPQMLARADAHLAELGYGEYYASTLVARPGEGAVTWVDLSGPSLVGRTLRVAANAPAVASAAARAVPAYYGRAHDLPDSFWEMGSLEFVREPALRVAEILDCCAGGGASVPELVARVFADQVARDPIRARFLHVTVELLGACLLAEGVLSLCA